MLKLTETIAQTSYNMVLIANKNEHNFGGTPAGWHYASCWGWTSPNGKEYAIIGYWNGTAVYDITDSANIYQCDTIPGPTSFYGYREFTVVGHYLYIVSEGFNNNAGLQIVDLQYLPDSLRHVKNWTFPGYLTTHTIKSSGNYLFLNGANYNGGAVVILDVSDPENPVKKGNCPAPYAHDSFIKNDTLYVANIYPPSGMSIIDIRDKDNPYLISNFYYSNAVCHNVWTSDDRRWLLTTDEGGSNHMKIWNIQDLNNITFVYEYIPYEHSMVHNAYFKGDTIFMAHYRAGVIALDVSNLPSQPVVIGYYDTYPGSGLQYQGAWNVYPYYQSGKFIVSDINTGLYVLKFGSPIGIQQNGNAVPDKFLLKQNYPNPFNPVTKINFQLPVSSYISIKIFDSSGKLIKVLYEGYRFAGNYAMDFNASELSSGVYFCMLTAWSENKNQTFTESIKMVLAK
ncbi:MAG: choice-of-anchor B family protein [Ignavibacteria bacterium]|nr:choice-of-anchor B family protein [Ignavibacteria bacterium]